MTVTEETKELVAEERHRIRLHDFVAENARKAISLIAEDHFPVKGDWSKEEFIERLKKYETVTSDLCSIQALLGYWGNQVHRQTLALAPKRICGCLKPVGGLTLLIALRWYPVVLLLYAGGISAIAARRYENLSAIMQAQIADSSRTYGETTLIRATVDAFNDMNDAFKMLPGHDRNYTPRSEYLFKLLQPILDDLLFLGSEYESLFDRFEVLLALEHAEQYASEKHARVWGPVGRFGSKFHREGESSPLHRVIAEAESQGDSWPPVKAGLFKGSVQRFKKIASEYSQLIAGLNWW